MGRTNSRITLEQLLLGLHHFEYSSRNTGSSIWTENIPFSLAQYLLGDDDFDATLCLLGLAVCVRRSRYPRSSPGFRLSGCSYNAGQMGASVRTGISGHLHIFRHSNGNGADACGQWNDRGIADRMAWNILCFRRIGGSLGRSVGMVRM